jgi:hypothetical protein
VAKTVTLLSYLARTRIGEKILLKSNPPVRPVYQAAAAPATATAVVAAVVAVAAATASVITSAIAISRAGEEG